PIATRGCREGPERLATAHKNEKLQLRGANLRYASPFFSPVSQFALLRPRKTILMNSDAPIAATSGPAAHRSDVAPAHRIADGSADVPPRPVATPEKHAAEVSPSTPPRSTGSGAGPTSSAKRRRLVSEDDDREPPRKSSCERDESDASDSDEDSDDDDSDDDSIEREVARWQEESVLRKIRKLNYDGDDDEDRLLHSTGRAKLFEYVTDYDIVDATRESAAARADESEEADGGGWKYRGSGSVKFVKCLEEGYDCGMIRMELTKNGTLHTLMRHELTHEEVVPMTSKKGKAYTWRCQDWAYHTATRTFAIRFDDDMDALQWKALLERSKRNNCRVRRGLDVPDGSAMDEVCSRFKNGL
ncbi:hypothetical protein ACHAWF_013201, partial [Thalassiosira exigua]